MWYCGSAHHVCTAMIGIHYCSDRESSDSYRENDMTVCANDNGQEIRKEASISRIATKRQASLFGRVRIREKLKLLLQLVVYELRNLFFKGC